MEDEEKKHSQFIQGWALVDNTQDEDWKDVTLSLVSGMPSSFIHDLYNPRYKRRETIAIEESDDIMIDSAAVAVDSYSARGLSSVATAARSAGPPKLRRPTSSPYSQQMYQQVPMNMLNRLPVDATPAVSTVSESVKVDTETSEVGTLFEYKIKNAVTVNRGQSALVPILQARFNGIRVALYNETTNAKNPLTAIFMKNTTGMTLESGPLTVFDEETYVGEAMLPTLVPNEKTFITYSTELNISIAADVSHSTTQAFASTIRHASLILSRYSEQKKNYCIRNKGDKSVVLYIEHRYQKGDWKLHKPEKADQITENYYRFKVDIGSGEKKEFEVVERSASSYSLHLASNLTLPRLNEWLESKYIDKNTFNQLEKLAGVHQEINDLSKSISSKEASIKSIFENQNRLRENLRVTGSDSTSKLRKRYLAQLEAEEDRLAKLNDELEVCKSEKHKLENKLNHSLQDVTYSATL